MKYTIVGWLGLALALFGAMYLSDLARKSWIGLAIGCAIFVGGMLFGKFGLQ